MAQNDRMNIFIGLGGGSQMLAIGFRIYNGECQTQTFNRSDSGTYIYTSWFVITDNPHYLEIEWPASSAAGANDGYLQPSIDSFLKQTLSSLDNDIRTVDETRLRPTAVDAGALGALLFYAFESRL